jgi:hypothetical protein
MSDSLTLSECAGFVFDAGAQCPFSILTMRCVIDYTSGAIALGLDVTLTLNRVPYDASVRPEDYGETFSVVRGPCSAQLQIIPLQWTKEFPASIHYKDGACDEYGDATMQVELFNGTWSGDASWSLGIPPTGGPSCSSPLTIFNRINFANTGDFTRDPATMEEIGDTHTVTTTDGISGAFMTTTFN